jgi:ribonuclease HI
MNRERDLLLTKSSAREVIETIMAMREDERLKCCFILWICWFERNRVREGLPAREPAWLVNSIQVQLTQWRSEDKGVPTARRGRVQRWEKPAENFVKVNCDAAFQSDTGNGGWGCVLRDSDGDFVMARRGRVEALMSLMHGELIACIHGVQAAIDAGVGHVVVETDAAEVVKAVYSEAYDFSAMTHLVQELHTLLVDNFISWFVKYCPRSCNRVGHELAILGTACAPEDDPILDSIPACIQCVLADDSAVVE